MSFVPGEPGSGPSLGNVTSSVGNQATGSGGGASVHVLHPQQFQAQLTPQLTSHQTAQGNAQRIKGLAGVASGASMSAVAHGTRDLLLSGAASPETQLGSAQVFRSNNAYA